MEGVRARTIVIAGLVLALVAVLTVVVLREVLRPGPGCTTALGEGAGPFTVEQADNAATIAGVGLAMGMPDHAVTVALATALQESGLRNLPDGDRDSAGLFQQRPSQGWGTLAQVTDPVHAATAFYAKLRTEPDWPTMSVTQAAQLVQRSATPAAYARWEPAARSLARALTGEDPAALTCHDLTLRVPPEDIATVGAAELGTARLSGPQPSARGWAIATWLVAHAARLGLDSVTYDGQTWTASKGAWNADGSSDGMLSLHRAAPSAAGGCSERTPTPTVHGACLLDQRPQLCAGDRSWSRDDYGQVAARQSRSRAVRLVGPGSPPADSSPTGAVTARAGTCRLLPVRWRAPG